MTPKEVRALMARIAEATGGELIGEENRAVYTILLPNNGCLNCSAFAFQEDDIMFLANVRDALNELKEGETYRKIINELISEIIKEENKQCVQQ